MRNMTQQGPWGAPLIVLNPVSFRVHPRVKSSPTSREDRVSTWRMQVGEVQQMLPLVVPMIFSGNTPIIAVPTMLVLALATGFQDSRTTKSRIIAITRASQLLVHRHATCVVRSHRSRL